MVLGGTSFVTTAARSHDGVFSNADVREDGRARANRGSLLDYRSLHLPVGFGLQVRHRQWSRADTDR